MKGKMKAKDFATKLISAFTSLFAIAWLCAVPSARAQSALPSPAAVASPRAYISIAPVPRGREFEVAVVVGIMPGFHMNAHKPSEEYLIPTTLTASLPAGVEELGTSYPAGIPLKLGFSDAPLLVYTKSVKLRVRLVAGGKAPLGKTTLPFSLRYQACNDTTCLPPVKIPVTAEIDVAATGAKTHSVNSEFFSPQAHSKRN
jgi:uncharacterized protein